MNCLEFLDNMKLLGHMMSKESIHFPGAISLLLIIPSTKLLLLGRREQRKGFYVFQFLDRLVCTIRMEARNDAKATVRRSFNAIMLGFSRATIGIPFG